MALVGIVGAGPGGVSTAVQLRRYGIESVIFERDKIGGLIRNAYKVENSMFFPDGIEGKKVAEILEDYIERYGILVKFEEVINIKENRGIYHILTAKGEYAFKYIVLASGTVPKRINVSFSNVYYHIVDLPNKCFRKVVIVGGGDVAYDYALSMSERSDEVIILCRNKPKALPALIKCVEGRRNINLIKGDLSTLTKLEPEVLLVAIGRIPNNNFARKVIGKERVYMVGDVKNGLYRQINIAIADGIKAAMRIWREEQYENT